jgi:hypothetical protein
LQNKKISIVELKHGSYGLVAEAGSTNSAEAVETMQQMAASKSLSHLLTRQDLVNSDVAVGKTWFDENKLLPSNRIDALIPRPACGFAVVAFDMHYRSGQILKINQTAAPAPALHFV